MDNYRIVNYYQAFNMAYLDYIQARKKVRDYSHKGEKVNPIYVILDSEETPQCFCLDACFYNHYDCLSDAENELQDLLE